MSEIKKDINKEEKKVNNKLTPSVYKKAIKIVLAEEGMTLTDIITELNKLGYKESPPNLSAKLQRGTISYKELSDMMNIMGRDIAFPKKPSSDFRVFRYGK